MLPPRNITYNGITVRKPSAVICDGRRYQIHFLLLDNDITLDNHSLSDYCMMHLNNLYSFVDFNSIEYVFLKREKYHHAEACYNTLKRWAGSDGSKSFMLTFVNKSWEFFIPWCFILMRKGFSLSACFCLHDSYLGRMFL